MSPSPSSENHSQFGSSVEGMVLVLAERMTAMQREMGVMSGKVDRMSSEQATQSALTEISGQIRRLQDQAENRLRSLEDWKTGIEAKVKLASGQWKWLCAFAALSSALAGLVGHFWK